CCGLTSLGMACSICAKLERIARFPELAVAFKIWEHSTISWTMYDRAGDDMATKSGAPDKLLEDLLHVMRKYQRHFYVLENQRAENRALELQCTPNKLLVRMDFSQNFVFNLHRRETQAAHWVTRAVTLFT